MNKKKKKKKKKKLKIDSFPINVSECVEKKERKKNSSFINAEIDRFPMEFLPFVGNFFIIVAAVVAVTDADNKTNNMSICSINFYLPNTSSNWL